MIDVFYTGTNRSARERTVGMNILQTPLFTREYESTLSAVRDEILREAPDCELVQLTDEIVIFGSPQEVTESALRRGLDVWNVQLREREEGRAKAEAEYMANTYRYDAWRARMTTWLEEQEKQVQRRKEVLDALSQGPPRDFEECGFNERRLRNFMVHRATRGRPENQWQT